MNKYLLDNYDISRFEALQSLFASEYGLRHWAHSKKHVPYKWGHRIIAVIELCPLIGFVATIIERLVAHCIRHNNFAPSFPIKHPPKTFLNQKGQYLFSGNQSGCNGEVSCDRAESIRAKLQACPSVGIHFNKEKITSAISGGTCTAMSLEFIDSYFNLKKTSIKQPNAQSDTLVDRLSKLASNFLSSSLEMRNRQAAFNTIEVQVVVNSGIDYSKNKIQSLINYHFLSINYASSEMDVSISKLNNKSAILKEINDLPEGVFLIRMLQPENNEKLEQKGHSLVYIKEHGLGLFYDPNYGLRNLLPLEHSEVLFERFNVCFNSFQTNKARFYRLQPTDTISST